MATMRPILAAMLAGAALCFAAPATASPTPQDFQRDVAIAVAYWGQTAPCGAPTIQLEATADVRTESGAPAGGWVSTIGAADCVIHVRDTPTNDWGTDPQGLCVLVSHELGHLLGYGHSPDPGSIMFGGTTLIPPVGCRPPVAPPAAAVPVAAKATPKVKHKARRYRRVRHHYRKAQA